MDDRASIIAQVCEALISGGEDDASDLIRTKYPFQPAPLTLRRYGPAEALDLFIRDGFIDRYSGARLVFPPVLHVLHLRNPEAFPQHPAWKTDATHPAFNELTATVDHVIPVTLGGADDPGNWVTTSMARNFAKSNFTLEELGWKLHPPGSFRQWDGLMAWFVEYCGRDPDVLSRSAVRKWYHAARRALAAA